MASTVLVTGAFGFLGRHVSRVFARAGHSVHGIGHGSWSSEEWGNWGLSEWHSADVTKDAIVSYGGEPDLIMHCAGSGSVGFSMSQPSKDFDRTVLTTREVLEYVRLHRPNARVVLASSASVYGNAKALPIRATESLHPVSPYGVHKRIAEEFCLSYAQHFGVSTAIVRLFSIYGIGLRKQLLWDACTKLSRGSATFGGTGQETRDWLHVDDAAKLLFAAGRVNFSGHMITNGATGVGVPTRQIVETIAQAYGGDSIVEFSGCSRPGDPLHQIADISEAESLGWCPKQVLNTELLRYVEWFKAGAP